MLPLTLTSVEIYHAGINVCSRSADGPHQRRQVLMHVRDGQGLTIQCPSPHRHYDATGLTRPHSSNVNNWKMALWISTSVTCKLENDNVNFCWWFCNTDNFVSPIALWKRVFLVLQFCLYIACVELTYFKKFPDCIYWFVHQNSRKIRSYAYNVAVCTDHDMQMRLKLRRVVCRSPDTARGVKCSGDHGKGGHEPNSSAESRKWRHLLLWMRKVVWKLVNISGNHEIAAGNAICRWDVVTKSVYVVKITGPSCFLIVSDVCISFPNLVDHRSAYLWPTSFERRGDVVWKSWLFPCAQSSFRARCWVPMKPLQQSCVKLKLHTGLAARTAYLKPRPWHPASVESNSLRQDWVINIWSICLSCYSTAAVRPSRGCSLPWCRTQRRLCGREPPGPDPHTTFWCPLFDAGVKCLTLMAKFWPSSQKNVWWMQKVNVAAAFTMCGGQFNVSCDFLKRTQSSDIFSWRFT